MKEPGELQSMGLQRDMLSNWAHTVVETEIFYFKMNSQKFSLVG